MIINKETSIIIVISLLITFVIILLIKYLKCTNKDFSNISKTINQEKVQLI